MALFKSKKNTKAEAKTEEKQVSTKAKEMVSLGNNYSGILREPRVTEKATDAAERNVYTFNVDPRATKNEIAKAVETIFKVKPVNVRTVTIPRKKTRYRGRPGMKSGGKKAYVELKKGETIDLM